MLCTIPEDEDEEDETGEDEVSEPESTLLTSTDSTPPTSTNSTRLVSPTSTGFDFDQLVYPIINVGSLGGDYSFHMFQDGDLDFGIWNATPMDNDVYEPSSISRRPASSTPTRTKLSSRWQLRCMRLGIRSGSGSG